MPLNFSFAARWNAWIDIILMKAFSIQDASCEADTI